MWKLGIDSDSKMFSVIIYQKFFIIYQKIIYQKSGIGFDSDSKLFSVIIYQKFIIYQKIIYPKGGNWDLTQIQRCFL